MRIKDRDTYVAINFTNTNKGTGLKKGEKWAKVFLIVSNKNFHYEVCRESLTVSEVFKGVNYLKDYYLTGNIQCPEMNFIKNYFILKCYPIVNNKKKIELKLISLLDKKEKKYSVFFEDDEIGEFVKLNENSQLYHSMNKV